ncbi:hypothetical protein OROGR_019635 [Orobanche gracilis]
MYTDHTPTFYGREIVSMKTLSLVHNKILSNIYEETYDSQKLKTVHEPMTYDTHDDTFCLRSTTSRKAPPGFRPSTPVEDDSGSSLFKEYGWARDALIPHGPLSYSIINGPLISDAERTFGPLEFICGLRPVSARKCLAYFGLLGQFRSNLFLEDFGYDGPGHIFHNIVDLNFLPTFHNYYFIIVSDSYFFNNWKSSFAYRLKTLGHVRTADVFEVKDRVQLIVFDFPEDERVVDLIILWRLNSCRFEDESFRKGRE